MPETLDGLLEREKAPDFATHSVPKSTGYVNSPPWDWSSNGTHPKASASTPSRSDEACSSKDEKARTPTDPTVRC